MSHETRSSQLANPPAVAPLQFRRGAALLLALLAGLGARPAAADHPLSYRFAPGTHLTYEFRTAELPLTGDQALGGRVDQVDLWCLKRSGGELLILLRATGAVDGRVEPTRALVLTIDAAGRRSFAPEAATRIGPLERVLDLLPPLPLQVQQPDRWDAPPDLFGRQWHCTSRGPDPAQTDAVRVEFRVSDPTGVSDVLGRSCAGRFSFDTTVAGLRRLDVEERDERRRRRTRVQAILQELNAESADWAARRVREADHFLRFLRHEDRLLRDLLLRPDDLATTLQQLDRLWSAFASTVDTRSSTPFRRIAEGRRALLRTQESQYRAWAALGRRWLSAPARAWSLQDPSGRTLTSETARAGIVFECFWSAETEWGLRALAPLRALRVDPWRPTTTILCYNLDERPDLARRAIERCGGRLRHVLGAPLRAAEQLPELPIVRVLDPTGQVRDIWIGWRPDYQPMLDAAWANSGTAQATGR